MLQGGSSSLLQGGSSFLFFSFFFSFLFFLFFFSFLLQGGSFSFFKVGLFLFFKVSLFLFFKVGLFLFFKVGLFLFFKVGFSIFRDLETHGLSSEMRHAKAYFYASPRARGLRLARAQSTAPRCKSVPVFQLLISSAK